MNVPAMKAVARGFVEGTMNASDFCSAIAALAMPQEDVPAKGRPAEPHLIPAGEKRVHPSWRLQPRIVTAVELWLAGNSYSVIAQTMGISPGSVGGTLAKARAATKSPSFYELSRRVVMPKPAD